MEIDESGECWTLTRENTSEVEFIGVITIFLDTQRENRARRMMERNDKLKEESKTDQP